MLFSSCLFRSLVVFPRFCLLKPSTIHGPISKRLLESTTRSEVLTFSHEGWLVIRGSTLQFLNCQESRRHMRQIARQVMQLSYIPTQHFWSRLRWTKSKWKKFREDKMSWNWGMRNLATQIFCGYFLQKRGVNVRLCQLQSPISSVAAELMFSVLLL